MKRAAFVTAACLIGLAGCESTEQQLDAQQQQAVDTALQRLRFDMNCPAATGQVLSREMVQPVSDPIRRRARRVHRRRGRLRPAPDDRRRLPAGWQRLLRGRSSPVRDDRRMHKPRAGGGGGRR